MNFTDYLPAPLCQGSHSNVVRNFRPFQHHKHQKIKPIVLPLTTFYIVLIRKRGSENVTWWKHFLQIYYNPQCREINCKNYWITDFVYQEHISQIQDFFSTSVQILDFSGPEKSKLKLISGPVGTLLCAEESRGPVGSCTHVWNTYKS